MANGYDKNWMRICWCIDGFRARFGRWPKVVRVPDLVLSDLVSHVLTPIGFALVSSYVEIAPAGEELKIVAEDGSGDEHPYGYDETRDGVLQEDRTEAFFGAAIVRPKPDWD